MNKSSKPSRVIKASEVRDFVYCPRSWKLWRCGIVPPPEVINHKKYEYAKGNRVHREHGEEVSRARSQSGRGSFLTMAVLAVVIGGGLAWKFL